MDAKLFWLIGFVLMAATGTSLILVRRYKNNDDSAGAAIAGVTLFILLLWVAAGANLLKN